jgi:foldase protein PrsA
MKPKLSAKAKRAVKIAVALALTLIGLVLLPVLALPYGGLDWLIYDPSYKGGYGYPPTPVPTRVPTSIPAPQPCVVPCAELPEPGEPLAATVNGQGIRLAAYERELDQFIQALVALGADLDSPEFQAGLPDVRRQVLDLMIDDVLVQQAACEFGITVTDDEIEIRMAEVVAESGGEEAFQAWLDETGQSWEEFRRDICQDILRLKVMEHVTADLPDEMEMVSVRQIVVATEQEAVSVLTQLASGEDFEDLAARVSLDTYTRDQGGDLGWFPHGLSRAAPEVEDAAFAAEPGQVQGPILVGEHYVVVQTTGYQAQRSLDPDTRRELQTVLFEEWLAQRREVAEIEIFVDFDSEAE